MNAATVPLYVEQDRPFIDLDLTGAEGQARTMHLASTNFLAGWFDRPYRRLRDWEQTAELWHRLVPARFKQRDEVEGAVRRGVRSAG